MITKGQIYEPLEDIEITCMTSWAIPFTGGYARVLKKGERFMISHDPVEGASAGCCDPLRYKALHKEMVPWTDRWSFLTYSGYYFGIDLEVIGSKCRLIKDIKESDQMDGH